jgi:hypothetical protein
LAKGNGFILVLERLPDFISVLLKYLVGMKGPKAGT